MDKLLQTIDFSEEQEEQAQFGDLFDTQSYENLTQISDFWIKKDFKQGTLASTEDSDHVLPYSKLQKRAESGPYERNFTADQIISFSTPKGKTRSFNFTAKREDDLNCHFYDTQDISLLSSVMGGDHQFNQIPMNSNHSFCSSMTLNDNHNRKPSTTQQKFNILICTDFAFPKFGGVETHGYQLGQCLIERGHKVTFLSNKFQGTRCGVRYMANGMKVYHLPHLPIMAGDVAFLTFFNAMPLIRQILVREQIEIVHGHQSTSILQHIVLMAAKAFGLKTVFTEHSLFGYNDFFAIHLNKLIKWSFRDLDAAICVSHACKDNFVLRAKFDPRKTFTVPNAVDSEKFTPDPSIREMELAKSGNPDQINIVFISRLEYRKGVDLLIGIIPKILAQFKNVHFIIGGDGQGMSNLKQLVEKHNLHGRVELLGGLPHEKVRDVLCRGHIFLNTSLTESFCIAILEAACCGLLVVSTDVGGVPEVLPPHMAYLAKPEEKSILRQLCQAVLNVKKIPTDKFYNQVASTYSWRQVAERTEKVYEFAASKPVPNILMRMKSTMAWGSVVGIWALLYTILEAIFVVIIDIFWPLQNIDVLPIFNHHVYNEDPISYGSHTLSVNHFLPLQNEIVNQNRFTPITLNMYSEEKPNEQIRMHSRTNRFNIIKPTAQTLSKQNEIKEQELAQKLENSFEMKNDELTIDEIDSKVSALYEVSDDSCSEYSTSRKHNKSKRKQQIEFETIQIQEQPCKQICYACASRLQPYECGQNFLYFQRVFEQNNIMQSFLVPTSPPQETPSKKQKHRKDYQQSEEVSTGYNTMQSRRSRTNRKSKNNSTHNRQNIQKQVHSSITAWSEQESEVKQNPIIYQRQQHHELKDEAKDLIDVHFVAGTEKGKTDAEEFFTLNGENNVQLILNQDSQMQVE